MRKILIRIILLFTAAFWLLRNKKINEEIQRYTPKQDEKVLPVTRIWQRAPGISHPRSACGPTTAAMITTFLAETNEIEAGKNQPNPAKHVNDLYHALGTYPWGTFSWQWRRRVEKYLNEHKKYGKWRVRQHYALRKFPLVCRSIDEGKPVILRFIYNFSKRTFASHHYVVAIGYKIENGKKFVAVRDPDGGKQNERIHWIDWKKNEKLIELLTIYQQKETEKVASM